MKGIEYEGDDTLYQICVSETNFTKQQLMLFYSTCTVASLKELKSKLDTFYLVGGFGGWQCIYKKLE